MDAKIKLQVDKIVVHKRIHEYLRQLATKETVKVEAKQQEDASVTPSLPPEVKQETHGSRISPQ
jgi:hypothetical protein